MNFTVFDMQEELAFQSGQPDETFISSNKKGNLFRDISNTRGNWYFIVLCYKRHKGLYMQMKCTVLTDILTVAYVSSQILYYLYSGFEEQ